MIVRLFSLLLLSILFVAGCTRPGEQQGEVSGKVTYQGKPLPGGMIVFVGPKGYTGTSSISPQGEYQLKASIGEVQISVDNQMLKPDPRLSSTTGRARYKKMRLSRPKEGGGKMEPEKLTGTYVRIPGRYADPTRSGLTYTVTPGSQTHDIELSDDSGETPGS